MIAPRTKDLVTRLFGKAKFSRDPLGDDLHALHAYRAIYLGIAKVKSHRVRYLISLSLVFDTIIIHDYLIIHRCRWRKEMRESALPRLPRFSIPLQHFQHFRHSFGGGTLSLLVAHNYIYRSRSSRDTRVAFSGSLPRFSPQPSISSRHARARARALDGKTYITIVVIIVHYRADSAFDKRLTDPFMESRSCLFRDRDRSRRLEHSRLLERPRDIGMPTGSLARTATSLSAARLSLSLCVDRTNFRAS